MIVRRDAPPGVQLAQTIHAAGWSAQLPGAGHASPPATHSVRSGRLLAALVGRFVAGMPLSSLRSSPRSSRLSLASAIALAASPDELAAIARSLAEAGVGHVRVHEPDEPWRGALMAIGVVPSPRALVRRFVAHLPLVRGKDDDHG